MAEMSPIDVLRRYQEYETELAPLLLGLLTASVMLLAERWRGEVASEI